MAIGTTIFEDDFVAMLADYDVGDYCGFETFANGAGQTTVLLEATGAKVVLRYYENRSDEHVDFEVRLLAFLRNRHFRVPAPVSNRRGEYKGSYRGRPYALIEFINGEHCSNPNDQFDPAAAVLAVQAVSQLHGVTKDYRPPYFQNREAFDTAYCWRQFQQRHPDLLEADDGRWFKSELDRLVLPAELPQGLCHADLNFGNFLFSAGKVVAVLDFDMSFYGPLVYDIASLIYWWAMPPMQSFRGDAARMIISEYDKCRPLGEQERAGVVNALKLIILLGISWGDRSEIPSNREKIEFLNTNGLRIAD